MRGLTGRGHRFEVFTQCLLKDSLKLDEHLTNLVQPFATTDRLSNRGERARLCARLFLHVGG